MRFLLVIFFASFVVSTATVAYLFGQKSVDTSLASLSSNSVSCLRDNNGSKNIIPASTKSKDTNGIKIVDKSSTKSHTKVAMKPNFSDVKETIDTTVIHAIRMGEWTDHDNRVFLSYLSSLDKKERISVLKQMNTAINFQQMKVGSYIPKF